MRVLFVCLGNICRSPAADAVMRKLAPDWEIDSAGTGAWHVGNPPDERSAAEGARRGYDLTSLRARQFAAADFDRFDHIYAMDRSNLRNIEKLRPSGNPTQVELFLENADVPDPYYEGGFDHMYDLIEKRCEELSKNA